MMFGVSSLAFVSACTASGEDVDEELGESREGTVPGWPWEAEPAPWSEAAGASNSG